MQACAQILTKHCTRKMPVKARSRCNNAEDWPSSSMVATRQEHNMKIHSMQKQNYQTHYAVARVQRLQSPQGCMTSCHDVALRERVWRHEVLEDGFEFIDERFGQLLEAWCGEVEKVVHVARWDAAVTLHEQRRVDGVELRVVDVSDAWRHTFVDRLDLLSKFVGELPSRWNALHVTSQYIPRV